MTASQCGGRQEDRERPPRERHRRARVLQIRRRLPTTGWRNSSPVLFERATTSRREWGQSRYAIADAAGRKAVNPNPPKDTDGRREDSGRGVRELQGRWPGLHWGRWEVGGRSSVAAQGPYGRLRELRCAGWRENTQQGTLADRGGASLRGRWVSCRLAVRPGVEWLAAGPRRE